MELLSQFLLRLSFGLAVGMAITSQKLVSSGYFRIHLYVILGLTTLAALALFQRSSGTAMWLAIAAAVLSYIGSVCWLYESPRAGRMLLWLVAACSLAAALVAQPPHTLDRSPTGLQPISAVLSGLVLGMVVAAMLLGHWYLNAPGMELAPLRRLLIVAAAAVALQALISGFGVAASVSSGAAISSAWLLFVALRWGFGLIGVLVLLGMAWQTLKIPNTQSATGILYVAVIGVFVGELAAQLLSANSVFPL